ncbi:MAG: aminotransferase class V-fold PLP-dependent enzyme [Bacteroidia bacterium]|nr:aminotransferase class V-fold PLP-dependent enzyme [Bacteroidia bacterium]
MNELNGGKLDWNEIREQFPISSNEIVQFNSGSSGTMPIAVQKELMELIKTMNAMPPYEALDMWENERSRTKERIASMLGVTKEELAFVRNTTEGLNNVLMGLPLKKDDEVICSNVDYPYPIYSINQRVEREGIQKVEVQLDLMQNSNEEIVEAYKNAITDKTKLILLTHMTHREGHILPISKICDMAHANGVEVLVDAAHSFAHVEHTISEFGCDYYATSLHKWLNAPHGTGLLYVAKSKIPKIFPLSPSDKKQNDNMVKFEYIGTRSFAHELGIGPALEFLEITGLTAKQEHLHALKKYWTDKVKNLKNVQLHSNTSQDKSCAIASFQIIGKSAGAILNQFEKEFKLHLKATGYKGEVGFLRVSPNIFTSYNNLDRLVDAIRITSN